MIMKNGPAFLINTNLSKTIFIILLLFSIHFWNLKYIPQKFNAENIFTWLICGFAFIMVSHKNHLRFKYPILIFIVGLILNCFASYRNLGQSPKLSILSFSYYYFILLYFLLHYFELEKKFLENTIIVFALFYSLIFIIQYKVFPYEIFNRWVRTATDELQLEIVGHGFLMIAFFLVLNRFLLNRRMIYILLALGFFIVQFKSGFWSLIAGAGLVSVFMAIRLIKFNFRDFALLVFVGLLFIGMMQYRGIAYIIDRMVSKTQQESQLGGKYIRMVQLEFFFKKYPKNLSYFIIGGGKPAGEKNISNFNPNAFGMNYNIVWVDTGLIGFYIVVGGVAVLGLVLYTLRAIFTKLPRDSLYLNFYFLYLLIVSFTNEEIYREGIFCVHAIVLYLIDITLNEKLNPAPLPVSTLKIPELDHKENSEAST
jgi:hypothetical protein